jgi:hypothetical protein
MKRDVESLYVEDMIERTTQNTIDDCIVFINMLGCLVIMWIILTILS